jgi:hypothetical protein
MKRLLAALLLALFLAAPAYAGKLKPGVYTVEPCPAQVVCPPATVCPEPLPPPVCAECPAQATVLPQHVPCVCSCVAPADRPAAGDLYLATPPPQSLPRWKKALMIGGAVLLARHIWMEADDHHGAPYAPQGRSHCED